MVAEEARVVGKKGRLAVYHHTCLATAIAEKYSI